MEAEQGVLGCILLSPNGCIETTENRLGREGEPFYDLKHRTLFQTIVDMHDKGTPIDAITIHQELSNRDKLNAVGGLPYLSLLPDKTPTAANLAYYLEIVHEKFLLRRLINACTETVAELYTHEADIQPFVSRAQTRLLTAVNRLGSGGIQEHWTMNQLSKYDVATDPNALVGWHDDKITRYQCRSFGGWIIGQSGIGKSTLGEQQCFLFALQKPFCGIMALRPLRSLIVQAENDIGDCAEAQQGIWTAAEFTEEERALLHERVKIIRCRGKTGRAFCQWLEREILLWKADMVYVDPLLRFAGIDVSRQDQCTRFLNDQLDPVLANTGVLLEAAHHTGKPKLSRDTKDWSIYDHAYAGIGSSELTNWARTIKIVRVLPNGTFELLLAKRGARAWATHPGGELPQTSIFLRHDPDRIFWRQIDPPEIKPKKEKESHAGRPNKVAQIASMNSFEFCSACTAEGEGLRPISRRLEAWLATQRIDISGGTTRRAIGELVANGKLVKNEAGLYLKGPNA